MPRFKTLPAVQGISVSYKAKYTAMCEEGAVPFSGTVTIEYEPREKLIEYQSFESWLYDIANDEFTIESFTKMLLDVLVEELGDITISIRLHAETMVHGPVETWATHWGPSQTLNEEQRFVDC